MTDIPTHELNDGTRLPAIGFGTYPMKGQECVESVHSALEAGYRLIDTAVNYGNEAEVGEAIRTSGVPRDEIIVTTKLPGRHHAYDDALASIRGSAERMGLDRIDLHLIHWPNPSVGQVRRGLARAGRPARGGAGPVGRRLQLHRGAPETVIDETGVTPVVNQIELHPYFPQAEMRAVHERLGIRTESWSPLGKRQAPFTEPPVASAAEKHGVTPGQVILRWQVQLGSVPIPKSSSPERQRANLDVFGFELTDDEVDAITALGRRDGRLFGGDPDRHEEM